MSIELQKPIFPYKTAYGEPWDEEWAQDWAKLVDIFNTIDHLEQLFNSLNVSYARELSQKQLILNLHKYAYSLHRIILEKYAD